MSLRLSLTDQAAASAGNFLVIVLGAHFLPIGEQGKLVYAYAAYIGLVLLNTSLFFAMAQIVKMGTSNHSCYRLALTKGQLISALVTSLGAAVGFFLFSDLLDWQLSGPEYSFLILFLLVQQYSDFRRRAGYVFDRISTSATTSMANLILRLTLLLIIRPDNAATVFGIMAAAALPGAAQTLREFLFASRDACQAAQQWDILRNHLALSRWHLLRAPLFWCGWHLPVFLVGILSSKESAAILGSLRAITAFANVFMELFETAIPAWLAKKLEGGGVGALRMASRRLFMAGMAVWFAGLMALWAFGKPIVTALLGSQYAPYASILLVIWTGNGIFFIVRTVGLYRRIARDTYTELAGSIGGVLMLALCLPLIDRYGIWGGAWALALVQIGTVIAILFSVRMLRTYQDRSNRRIQGHE